MRDWIQLFAEGAPAGTGGAEAGAGEAGEATAQAPSSARHWQAVDRIYAGLMEQAEGVRRVFPGFDLRRELADKRFTGAIRGGLDMRGAYYGIHGQQILGEAMAYAAARTRAAMASSIASGRPGENGLAGGGAVQLGTSVAAMTQADYASICRRVERGERVSFG